MIESSELRQARILIVDDQEANLILLEKILRTEGYSDLTVTMDPSQVAPLHREHRYDLILLDLQMPVMDGFAVMEQLKADEPSGYLPVLVITAQPGHKLRALQSGARDFVTKPFDLIEVQTRIRNMLEVRLLYRQLGQVNEQLEQKVLARTAELRESEERFKSFTQLSSDWYWEQDAAGRFTRVSGPVFDMLGIAQGGAPDPDAAPVTAGWNTTERAQLSEHIAARRPFVDFVYSRRHADGKLQFLQVSGEPILDAVSRFIGYRGIGMDITERMIADPDAARWRCAIDQIPVGLLLVDRARMRAVDANATACIVIGQSKEMLLRSSLEELGLGSDFDLRSIFDALSTDLTEAAMLSSLSPRGSEGNPSKLGDIEWRMLRSQPGSEESLVIGVIRAATAL